MTSQQKKDKILAAIADRGWFLAELFVNEARELQAAGTIRRETRYFTGGNPKAVWVAA